MSTPPIQHIWTLHRRDIFGGGEDLHGCHIVSTDAGFQFTEPDIRKILSFTSPTLPQIVPFTFPVFEYKEQEWAITLWTLPIGAKGTGAWATPGRKLRGATLGRKPETDPQSGDFTAQAGGSIAPDEATYGAKA